MYLFFDTETTGLPDQRMPAEWEGQPRICQLGAILADEHGFVRAEVNLLIRPDGWRIPEGASSVHGIAQGDAERYGFSIRAALSIFCRLMAMAQTLVAHNLSFDLFMVEIEASRADTSNMRFDFPENSYCTMTRSTHILRLPPTKRMAERGMTEFKRPNLQEAYRHFFGRDFEGAHDAMADVRACRDVFFALKRLEVTDVNPSGAAA